MILERLGKCVEALEVIRGPLGGRCIFNMCVSVLGKPERSSSLFIRTMHMNGVNQPAHFQPARCFKINEVAS